MPEPKRSSVVYSKNEFTMTDETNPVVEVPVVEVETPTVETPVVEASAHEEVAVPAADETNPVA